MSTLGNVFIPLRDWGGGGETTEESTKDQKSDLKNFVQFVTFRCTQQLEAGKVLLRRREISI